MKKQFTEMEQKILDTWAILERDHSAIAKLATIQRILIDFNSELERGMMTLQTVISVSENPAIAERIKRSTRATIKNLEKHIETLRNIDADIIGVEGKETME
ncbi:MAG: hypothetical protein LBT51_10550 [Fusobacteriaceae bacterium]|jgi:hypothetical protein|nr:hypothetical protein [Fusobacteriaceae bacterium]